MTQNREERLAAARASYKERYANDAEYRDRKKKQKAMSRARAQAKEDGVTRRPTVAGDPSHGQSGRQERRRDKARTELGVTRPRTTHWTQQAACVGTSLEDFFNDWGYPEAKKICARCPVQSECLKAYLFEPYGVFGGMSPHDRENYRRALRRRTK